jgi:hypothetical protein
MEMSTMQTVGAALFGPVLLHTFDAKYFEVLARRRCAPPSRWPGSGWAWCRWPAR